ncbi:pyridoxamine 5'-phosphate oxidase family protein [Curtobacterium sp. MCPF17_052]|uniref:pyridoxamine 5'-phosphate oxidase family protein n=1 Tax=Curtobacterium sp. MCPF17_052 TaxID=2175655 RepID=UPI0024DFC235|nr:pyridoxamine 5'-phosphate oxidase family protein [Curtobacterium sp. MCPF17_052]WIB12291.1 pyridoxamine 5'-phosphate oxidase family protein [Curtobacterium sp. MCPF17_052]
MPTDDALPSLTVRRLRDRQQTDPEALRQVLAEGFVAHVGLVRDGFPIVLPFLYGVGDLGAGPVLLLHGSTGGGLFLDAGANGVPVSATITHVDGIVFARSTFDSSANYRSAMVVGRATVVPAELRADALRQVSDHLMPGRRAELREMTAKEVRQTQVLQLPLDAASVKVRAAGVGGVTRRRRGSPHLGRRPARRTPGGGHRCPARSPRTRQPRSMPPWSRSPHDSTRSPRDGRPGSPPRDEFRR